MRFTPKEQSQVFIGSTHGDSRSGVDQRGGPGDIKLGLNNKGLKIVILKTHDGFALVADGGGVPEVLAPPILLEGASGA